MHGDSPHNAPAHDRPAEPESERDERLAAVLARLAEAIRSGAPAGLDEACSEHPDLAGELRELFGAIVVAEGVAARAAASDGSRGGRELDSPPTMTISRGGRSIREGTKRVQVGAERLPRDFGDYELLDVLGRGGMGIVYRARQKTLGRIVALKMILRGEMASSAELARFHTEAEAAARLDHPRIVPVYEVGTHDGAAFFAMKLVEGVTLAERLAEGPLPEREAALVLADVSEAIHYAHRAGVLHRDLKPSNILLDADGRAFVTDFGLAKWMEGGESLTRSGAVLGTPAYMPPEQAAGNRGQLGPSSDVYSLGTILYQMLTGRPPFQAATPVDTVLLVLEQEPLPPRMLNPRADRDLEMISLKCLQKPPDLRYSSAQSLADDLRAFLNGEPIAARSGAFTQVVARWFRETHHAPVLESWGLLWMWHALVLLVLCLLTNWLQGRVPARWPYVTLWTLGLGTWAAIFWALRRRGGPVTFVERQIAHVWGACMAGIAGLFAVEWLMELPVLKLSPVLGLMTGAMLVVKAATLTGSFYFYAAALFATSGLMCLFPDYAVSMFGLVSAACFFLPGLKYHRQRLRSERGTKG